MLKEIEWTNNAKICLRLTGLEAFEVEDALLSGHGRRRENYQRSSKSKKDADWIVWVPLRGGRGILVARYDWPARKGLDETRARLVSFWVEK